MNANIRGLGEILNMNGPHYIQVLEGRSGNYFKYNIQHLEYLYKEVNISSAELYNLQSIPVVILPKAGINKYYDWYMQLEFKVGSDVYNPLAGGVWYINHGDKSICIGSPYVNTENVAVKIQPISMINDAFADYILDIKMNQNITLSSNGDVEDGNGTVKIKIWYKTITFD